ncbi:ribonuclease HII [Robbsia sp. KACC 23696]|uniref:ribonuclease HII n=1 Tax=Robbsia sp. KACC 23696 TaxID=3149231 RepID=UPI00325A521F
MAKTPKATTTAPAKRARRNASAALQSSLCFDVPGQLACGVDEAGRGPLAGTVVAAAVILDPARPIAGLDDSKALSAKTRERLYDEIVANALSYSIAEASVAEIDTLNILQATMLAMRRAVEGLHVTPDIAYIDGNRCPAIAVRAEAVVGGDALVPSISAASILAKVTRDRQLAALHLAHPHYGFNAHMGYGTAQHLAALAEHGPCAHHRRSFAPVREAWARIEAAQTSTDISVAPTATIGEGNDASAAVPPAFTTQTSDMQGGDARSAP